MHQILINVYYRSDSIGMFIYRVRIDNWYSEKKKKKIIKVMHLGFFDSFGCYSATSL